MQLVQSVDRSLTILEVISEYRDGLGITEISEKVELHKSTVHRLLQTLMEKGYVMQIEESKNYTISFKLYEIGRRKVQSLDIFKISKKYIEELSRDVNETVHMVIRDGNQAVYIDKVEGDNTFNMGSKIGSRAPMYSTSVGKAILAYSDIEDVKNVWDNSEIIKKTETTIVDFDEFVLELDKIRKQGYSIDNEENESGVRCIGAPIFNRNGKVKASISVSGASFRMTDEKMEIVEKKILKIVEKINSDLGYFK